MSSPIVISEHQTSPLWRWIKPSGNNTQFSVPYCILTVILNALQAWVTQETQCTITTLILCGFTLSEDSFWVTLGTTCLSNLMFFFKRVVTLSLMKPISQQDFNQVYMQDWKIEAWFCHFEKKKTVIKRKNKFTKQKRKSKVLFTSW